MLNYQVKSGLVPIRRDCTPRPGIFNWEKGEARLCVDAGELGRADVVIPVE